MFFAFFKTLFYEQVDFVEIILLRLLRFHKKILLKINYINFCINLISSCFIFEILLMNKIELKSSNKNDSNLISLVE